MQVYKRHALKRLNNWYKSQGRTPLILLGARQVGKTTLVNNFASTNKLNYFYLNLEDPMTREMFQDTKTVQNVLDTLYVMFNKKVTPNSLIFFDEIQKAPHLIELLRFFKEQYPQFAVIVSGSWLNVYLHKYTQSQNFSFPVGRVDFMTLFPFSFLEYLENANPAAYEKLTTTSFTQIIESTHLHAVYMQFFRDYMVLGGMPKVLQTCHLQPCLEGIHAQRDLLNTILEDVERYVPHNPLYATKIINTIFANPARAFKKTTLIPNASLKTINLILHALHKAFLISTVKRTYSTSIPLKPAPKNAAKYLALDIGLALGIKGLTKDLLPLVSNDQAFFRLLEDTNKGMLNEQVVGQLLLSTLYSTQYLPNMDNLYYWQNKDSSAEIDFVITQKGRLVGIEVKSGKAGKLGSLISFLNKTEDSVGIRVYSGVPKIEDVSHSPRPIISIPFYMVELLPQILEEVK